MRWSRDNVLESPIIGYAPLESQRMRWAKESLIEGWFPIIIGECQGLKVIRCPEERTTQSQEQSRRTGHELRESCVSSDRIKDVTQSPRLGAADAGCKIFRRTGKVRLDTLPHRNPHKPVFSKIRQVATSRQIAMDSAEDSKMFRYLQVDQSIFRYLQVDQSI
jgi:hypothetical protein